MASDNCTESVECAQIRCPNTSHDLDVVNIVLLVSAVLLFVILILKDAVKGLRSKAHWVPGDFLVLSALTIQLLNLISTQGEPLSLQPNITLIKFWMIHTSRVMLFVVVGYLMPGMANPGSEDFWGKIMGLALIVFLHVLAELYIINPKSPGFYLEILWPRQQGISIPLYFILATLMLSSFVLLLLLLGCANIAGRGIERIIAQNIPVILKGQVEEDHQHSYEGLWRAEQEHRQHYFRCKRCWRRVEDAVLRAWIVARAYPLEHIIARSALASSAATIVTIQIAITIVAGVWNSSHIGICNPYDRVMLAITVLQCVFILIGWSMILWRWATAVAYYGSWSRSLPIEDFWTRHLRRLQQSKETRLPQAQLLHAKTERLVANKLTKVILPGKLLYAVIGLQWFTVSFSKACWLASVILFRNKLTGKLLSLILSKLERDCSAEYRRILEGVQMLGETPESLWLSNRKSIPRAAALISQGKQDAEEKCQHLVEFLATKRTGRGLGLCCLEPYKPQTGLKYLCKRSPIDKEEELTVMSTKPWKMTAMSLLGIIVQLYPICATIDKERPSTSHSLPPNFVDHCLEAYSQAWEIIDFVEEADTEPDKITSEAADEYFATLETKLDKSREATPPESVTAALAELKRECKSKTQIPGSVHSLSEPGSKSKEKTQGCPNSWTGKDSIDWKAAAWGSAVYNLCISIECNEGTDVNDLLKELESSLADIINDCLEKIQHLLLVNSRKWAVSSDERRIAKALFTTGKAMIIMEKLETRDKIIMEERSGSAIVPYHG